MHLVLDIFQGIGIASAAGIRPFLPALAVGALAAGDIQINFDGTDFSFLESGPFLLGVLVAAVVIALLARGLGPDATISGPLALVLAAAGLAIGALFFGGALAQDHYAAWPGLIGGVLCAAVGVAATRPLLARVGGRLDLEAASALPIYAEVAAIAIAALSVLLPPVGLVALAFLGWLLLAGRRREQQKYAGLRILK